MAESENGDIPPNATFVHCTSVYIRNLDENIKIPTLVDTLRPIFEEYGNVIDIIAKKSLKRRGQAFIVYDNADSAQEAIDELQGFDLLGQQMRLEFAKSRSDATVLREDGEEGLEKHKQQRLAEKAERKQAAEAAAAAQLAKQKRAADSNLAERPAKSSKPSAATGVVPEEYLPPNKILLLRDVPESYGKDMLSIIFGRFPGFKEVRMVPTRVGIAFVEYEDETGAIAAKEALSGQKLGDQEIKITYQRAQA
ncbi:RNA recognition motif (aka RRM, RBD, or RNP domain) [Teratosphaeria destructans]|uniref:RNA recognition motif (Aka RRM, RBD, or RNP domain) n=1 Tax=Teratosphaeria destructans TaxID=418781 RepID=A0A9W7T1I8_9PEZI|nr:RNA recognition motif (aka RRM, RBD, or RNP domain) [Teratosphaeria destructans]